MDTLRGKTVLVTGGTGSFGSTFARHALAAGVSELRILSRDEAKQDALRHELANHNAAFYLGDTRSMESVTQAVRGVDYVFHAAALKQVPSGEFFPIETVKTNILGSQNVLQACFDNQVESAVFLSTDKAVYPINAMGQTKALMEKLVTSAARHNLNRRTRVNVTRYGNVLFSRGSVVPLFLQQIAQGKPLTVTDGRMTRFLMSLDESVDLVMKAMGSESSGSIFVRKAPAATMQVLAEAVSALCEVETEILEIGFRHGEKLYESLVGAEERLHSEDLGHYFEIPMDVRNLNYKAFVSEGTSVPAGTQEPYTSHNTERLELSETVRLLRNNPQVRMALSE